ncbi:NAD-dependent epimerase/dehydratase family protein [Sphingomonas faeni]|uniref:NAD-dependent epimerase/dehydratase family protein n=1 Tax=Sphingomonas faeni TaxID=185950 RepID=UPI003593DDC8
MVTVAITGITGLAGGRVAHALNAAGHRVIGISRTASGDGAGGIIRTVADLTDVVSLTAALHGCDAVFHFADRADRKSYEEAHVGIAATNLTAIRAACEANGISRIVAASSIYAERRDRPDDRYVRSKKAMEAAGLAPISAPPALILRLPPLHGQGARGAVRHIANAVAKGWPLPFAVAKAPRRFLSLDALADLCVHLLQIDNSIFARAAGKIWVPVNVQQGSLAALTRAFGQGKARLLPVPWIDRILGGHVSRQQLENDRDALENAIGWQAKY